ncbi:MAG: integrase core domain-containing protein [Anaerolineae bacterium]
MDALPTANSKMRNELLDREIFYALAKAQTLLRRWREEYVQIRPHSALEMPKANLSILIDWPPACTR